MTVRHCPAQSLTAVLCAGDDVPGSPGTPIVKLETQSVSNAGHVVGFLHSGSTADEMVFVTDPSGVTQKVIQKGENDSTLGKPIQFLGRALVADSGKVAVDARLTLDSGNKPAIIIGSPGSMETVAYSGQSVPNIGSGMEVISLSPVLMNNSGNVAFLIDARVPNSTVGWGVWKDGAIVLKTDAPQAGLDPGFGLKEIFEVELNNDGDLLIHARAHRLSDGGLNQEGLWLFSGGALTEVANSFAGPPPGFPSALSNFELLGFASGQNAAFRARSGADTYYVVSQGATLMPVLNVDDDPVPGVGGGEWFAGSPARRFDISSDGRAMLAAQLRFGPGGVDGSSDWGAWVWNGSGLDLLIREGDPIPDAPGETVRFVNARMQPDGRTIVGLSSSGSSHGIFSDNGGGGLSRITYADMPITLTDGTQTTAPNVGSGVPNSERSEGWRQQIDGTGNLLFDARFTSHNNDNCAAFLGLGPVITDPTKGSITGEVRIDEDGDGNFGDPDDMRFSHVTLRLFADDGTGTITPVPGQIADVLAGGSPGAPPGEPIGGYTFADLDPGLYVVVAELTGAAADGYSFTAPAGAKRLASVTAGGIDSGNDFLVTLPEEIVSVQLMRQENYTRTPGDRTPLTPLTNLSELGNFSPLAPGGGLVADGVTPLLIKVLVGQAPLDRDLRWEITNKNAGSVAGGISKRVRVFGSGNTWQPFVPGTQNFQARITGSEGLAYLAIYPLEPSELVLPAAVNEVELELRIFSATTGSLVSIPVPIKLRRPPVFLIPSDPAEKWETEFLSALHTSRHPDFVKQLSYDSLKILSDDDNVLYYSLQNVLAELEWESKVNEIRQEWAMVWPDIIAHGAGGAIVQGLSLTNGPNGYRNDHSFGRGRFRAAVTLGSPQAGGVGLVQIYALEAEKRLRELDLPEYGGLPHIPETIKKVPAWTTDLNALLARQLILDRPGSLPSHDKFAPLHPITTRIDSAASKVFPQIGFYPSAQAALIPEGSDGVVDVDIETFGLSGANHTVLPGFFAHGEDTSLFGDADKQTASSIVATSAIGILDQSDLSLYLSAEAIGIRRDALRGVALAKFGLARRFVTDSISPKLATLSPVAPGRGRGVDRNFTVELQEAPSEIRTAGPFWFAEVFGPDGVTSEGVTLDPGASGPSSVDVSVAGSVIGDVILYSTYEANGTTVFATPIRVASNEPDGATAQSLRLEPSGIAVNLGEEVSPVVWVNYSDGSSLRRWLHPDDFTVTSSQPGIVDVSAETLWVAESTGEATLTLNFGGLTAQSTLKVIDPYPPVNYAAWKAEQFDAAELADPLVSGDEADLDGDGLNTFFEYITGGDPRVSDLDHQPQIRTIDLGDEPQLVFAVRISNRVSGENVVVQNSPDLATWEEVPQTEPALLAEIDLGSFRELWFDLGDVSSDEFYRLAVNPVGVDIGTVTGTTEFPFSFYNPNTNYGDRVDAQTIGPDSYEGVAPYTPNVMVDFPGNTGRRTSGFGDLRASVYSPSGPLQIELVADPGFAVRLDSFDLAGFFGDRTAGTIEIQDIDGVVLWSATDFLAPGTGHAHLDFTDPIVQSSIIRIVIDNVSGDDGNVAIDNLRFHQVELAGRGNFTILTFENELAFGSPVIQDYGDRVTGALTSGHSYSGGGSFTPGILTSYAPVGGARYGFGFNSLDAPLWNSQGQTTPLTLTLTADAGQQVRLDGFDMARLATVTGSVNSIQVLDGSGTELFGMSNVDLSDSRTRFDFTAAPLVASEIVIRWDSSNLGANARNVAIDNVTFGQVPES